MAPDPYSGRHAGSLLGLGGIVKEDGPLLLVIALIIGLGALAANLEGAGDRFSLFIYPQTAILLAILMSSVGLVIFALYTMLVVRPRFPIRYIVDRLAVWLLSIGVIRLAVLIVAFTLFLSVVSSLKTLIPVFEPFHWDPLLARFDAALYGGVAPWRWLQPLLGTPQITRTINFAYNFWFFLMIGLLLWQVVDVRRPALREQFLMSFVLAWFLNGVVLASIFSSVGPCFYGRLMPHQADPFAPLMAYLRHADALVPIWAVSTQNHLWQLYQGSDLGVGAGISAMPSMHISLAWLMFLLFRRLHRLAGWIMFIYVLVIVIGSVHLAWHYSLDGYVSIATTSLIWFSVGIWCRHRWRGAASAIGHRHYVAGRSTQARGNPECKQSDS